VDGLPLFRRSLSFEFFFSESQPLSPIRVAFNPPTFRASLSLSPYFQRHFWKGSRLAAHSQSHIHIFAVGFQGDLIYLSSWLKRVESEGFIHTSYNQAIDRLNTVGHPRAVILRLLFCGRLCPIPRASFFHCGN